MEIILYTLIIVLAVIHLLRIAIYLAARDIQEVERFRSHMKRARSRISRPLASVVVPSKDSESTIEMTIKSILYNTYQNFEVIVVDYGSTDRTCRIVRKIIKENPDARLKLVRQKADSKAAALNAAIEKNVRGTLVMCHDPSVALSRDAIERAVVHFQNDRKLAALVSNIKAAGSLSRSQKIAQELEVIIGSRVKRLSSLLNIEYNINGISATYRKSHLKKIGYFTDSSNDTDLTLDAIDRMCNNKLRVGYGHDVYTVTHISPELKDRIIKRFNWKYGRIETAYKNKSLFLSKEPEESKLLSWFRLPYAVYGDILLTIEPIFAAFFIINLALLVQPWIVFWSVLLLTFYVSFILMVSNQEGLRLSQKLQLLLFAPFAWVMFYVITLVDYRTIVINQHQMRVGGIRSRFIV